MTGTSYRRSAELAAVVGPYAGYARNADAHQRVMRKHQAANDTVRALAIEDDLVHKLATKEWAQVVELGKTNGFRNAQASVLAPTGTIGFMMDCDTTGIEPDFSLVKFKKLVGGGSMQIVNQTIPRALRKMGYQPESVEAIVDYIAEHGHVIDAPGLRQEHYEVFDTAMGARSLKPMGHVRMMAACQPFLSGAISKTVNLPETATVEEIEDVFLQSWKLGLKATAIYRDNCKVGQPLSDGKSDSSKKDQGMAAAAQAGNAPVTELEPKVVEVYKPLRRRLPKSRVSRTTSFTVGGAEGYMTSGAHDDGELGEVFLKLGKQGSTLAGVMDAFSIAVSIGLQYGVPLETYVSKFTNLSFEPAGLTDDADVRMSKSIMDYIFRRLALDYLDFETRQGLGVFSADERQRYLETGSYEPLEELGSPVRGRRQSDSCYRPVSLSRPRSRGRRRRRGRRDQGHPRLRAARGPGRTRQAGPHQRRAPRADHRHRRRLPPLHDLRHQDAPRRLLLRLRGLRQHQRLQLTFGSRRRWWSSIWPAPLNGQSMTDPKVAQRVVPRTYRVSGRGDLVEYILAALESTGSTVLYCSQSTCMPLYVALMTPAGERRGLMVYAFRMTQVETKNRAIGELRGQIRYGSEDSWPDDDHELAFDVANVDTTLVLGVSPERALIVGLDPHLYDPLPMGISFYAQEAVVNRVAAEGFAVWERENHAGAP